MEHPVFLQCIKKEVNLIWKVLNMYYNEKICTVKVRDVPCKLRMFLIF